MTKTLTKIADLKEKNGKLLADNKWKANLMNDFFGSVFDNVAP